MARDVRCCICGSTNDVVWCDLCGHRFCIKHRTLLWGWGQRTAAAVKELVLRMPPPYCDHEEGQE